ncbi:MAG: esterase/lipase family protein [Acidimicrobiia bacterium]
MREPLRLLGHRLQLRTPAARRRVVVTIPGVGSSGLAMAPLRRYLTSIGHDAHDWGQGRNDSREFTALHQRLIARVEELAGHHGDTIDLIGWSLGGMFARATARSIPDSIGQIITYGTPVIGGPRYTIMAASFSAQDTARIEQRIEERRRSDPLTVPVTAIYSRNDGVVAWEACIDPDDDGVEHIEVASSHIGMNLDPDVWRAIQERLNRAHPQTTNRP